MPRGHESPPTNADGNDGNLFFFTAVWDEDGETKVALLNRSDDLEVSIIYYDEL